MPGLLDNFLNDPNLALGAGLLSPTKDEGFGSALSQGLLARGASRAANSVDNLRQLEAQFAQRKLTDGVPIVETALQKNARAAGFTPGTQGYQEYIRQNMGAKTSPHFTAIPGAQGALVMDARTGNIDFKPYPEQFGGPAQYDPNLQREVAAQRQFGLGGAEAITEPRTAAEVDRAKYGVEKEINQPKKEAAISATTAKTEVVSDAIDQAIDQSGLWTTGFLGSASSWIPGTPAFDLSNTLSTIKANIGFDRLQEMRDNSPTGGALGQVSEFENRLLQNVWSSVEQAQSPDQLKENLLKVKQQVKKSWERVNDAYKADYGESYKGNSVSPSPEGVSQEVWEIMTPQERALWR